MDLINSALQTFERSKRPHPFDAQCQPCIPPLQRQKLIPPDLNEAAPDLNEAAAVDTTFLQSPENYYFP